MSVKLAAFVAGVALVVLVGTASAAEPPFPYPSPAFDFAHAASPHSAFFSTAAGNRTIPLLVVYGTFTDVTEVPGISAGVIAGEIFPIGTTQTIADYFSTASGGRLRFVPAGESQGTPNDGVVQVSLGVNAVFEGLFGSGGFTAQGRAVVQAADPFVNYSTFDANGDGQITSNELAILSIKTSALPTDNCGVTAGIGAGSNDGVNLATAGWSDTVTLTNQMTLAHELAHLVLGTVDNSYIPGRFDILGPTCGGPRFSFWLPNSYNALHWGWVNPTVVARDGYYNVSPGSPYLLYDPTRGTNDYFLVENREASTYDTNRSDSGLAIWQVQDNLWGTARGAFELIRPGGGTTSNNYTGSTTDAWDANDPATPQRAMTSPWRDGTAAKVAVRAIGNAGGVMRTYFDVRGPGVLVDTYVLANSPPINLTLGAAGAVSFPVMNTGEATESFNFTITGLPPGWTATTSTQTLAAGAASTANVQVTPPVTATPGLYPLSAIGTNSADPSVTTSSNFTVKVVQRPTTIVYTGDLTADYHDPAQLSALLTDTLTGAPLAGKTVHFSLGTQAVDATTLASGVASATVVVTQTPGPVPLAASFSGDGTYLPSTDSKTFTITREQTTTTYTGPTVILQGASGVTLEAKLLEDGTTPPFPSGQTLTLSLGSQSCTATVDAAGIARCMLTFTGALGSQPLAATFAGDAYYLPSSDTGKTAIVFAFPVRGAFVLADATAAAAGAGSVEWWGAQWNSRNTFFLGAGPAAFKGFAGTPRNLPKTSPAGDCTGTWTTAPGNSSKPVGEVPSYMGVLVAGTATKSGPVVSGSYARIVVVRTDPGYSANPGHPGTGRIVATFCP